MSELHRRGIVHRDLKPGNVMMVQRSGPRILDFGLAKDLAATSMTEAGHMVGTPLYASPEMHRGEQPAPPSDVFQLGLIFYEALTARRDFHSTHAPDILRAALLRDEGLRAQAAAPLVERLVEVYRKSTCPDIPLRYADAGALLADVQRALSDWDALSGKKSTPISVIAKPRITDPKDAKVPVAAPPPPPAASWAGTAVKAVLVLILVSVVALTLVLLPAINRRFG
jgi:serine/threonine protein kinase